MNFNNNIRNTLLLGFALFAMFFGAGNLIFPPSIGLASGTNWPIALVGFTITGIVLPLLGVIAILNAEGRFEVLTQPISPWFYKVFNVAVMVGIGMFVTIPRMAATTHELGVQTLMPQIPPVVTILVYFSINFYFAMDKSNVVDKIGKVLTPILVIILLFIVVKGVLNPLGTPSATELPNPFSHAFINAYQTGDVITGILLAPIFIAAIIGHGYKDTSSVRNVTINATIIAGLGLLIVYGGLLYLGATSTGQFPADIDNTALVTGLVHKLLGNLGTTLLAVAIALACLTSSIGVTAVLADFLHDRPFLGDDENYGISTTSEQELLEAAKFAERHQIQLVVHAMGEQAIDLIVNTFYGKKGWLSDAPSIRIEHAAMPTKQAIQRAAEMGIGFVPQPIFLYAEIESYLNNLGAERTKQSYPVRTMLDVGIKVAFSSDAPATAWADPVNPFVGLKAAVTRKAFDGTDTGQEQRVDVETAVTLYTRAAQEITRIPDIGQLKSGYHADFIVLDQDILEISPEKIDEVAVEETYLSGELVYKKEAVAVN